MNINRIYNIQAHQQSGLPLSDPETTLKALGDRNTGFQYISFGHRSSSNSGIRFCGGQYRIRYPCSSHCLHLHVRRVFEAGLKTVFNQWGVNRNAYW